MSETRMSSITKIAGAVMAGLLAAAGCNGDDAGAHVLLDTDGGVKKADSGEKKADAGEKSSDAGEKSSDAGEKSSDAGEKSDGAQTHDSAALCDKHLPAGFTQVLVSTGIVSTLTGDATARTQAMALDGDDDPMFAYASEDSGSSWSIRFVRWDACTGRFAKPITVETLHPFTGAPDVSLAYDPVTQEVGIAYEKGVTNNGWADDCTETWLGTMKAPATEFTIQPLTNCLPHYDYYGTASPSIAMQKGTIAVAYEQGPYPGGNGPYVWLLTSTAKASAPSDALPPSLDGGADAEDGASDASDSGEAGDAGPPPPHFFTYRAVPYSGDQAGYGNGYLYPVFGSGVVSVAIDANDVPAVAAYQVLGTIDSYPKELVYWSAETVGAVGVYGFAVDGSVDVSLAFDGTKPRIAGHMDSPGAAGSDSLAFFASADGVTWSSVVHLPDNDGSQDTAFTSALAIDGLGQAAVASDINGGVGNGKSCGTNPYVATSPTDDGQGAWTACGADKTGVHHYSSYSVSAFYGGTRAKGTLMVSFISGASNDAGADQPGILYWLAP
jgi:hypothetical protein